MNSQAMLSRLEQEEAACRRIGDYDGALEILNRMIALDATYSPAFNNKGAILLMKGRYQEALPVLQRAAELNPANAIAFNNVGLCLYSLAMVEEAIPYFRQALAKGYQHEGVNYNLGKALFAAGQHQAALDEWAVALRKNPAYMELLAHLYRLGQSVGAVQPGDQINERTIALIKAKIGDYNIEIVGGPDGMLMITPRR